MKKRAGWRLRSELRERAERARLSMFRAAVIGNVFAGIAIGIAIAILLSVASSFSSLPARAYDWLLMLLGVVFAILCVIVSERDFARERRGRRHMANMTKGLDAEERIGDSIEHAIMARGCAAAHNVTEIAKVGDIDHIVLTPARLWVVETKSGRVPRSEFPKTLGRIAANAKAVREWARDAEVQGYLALASDDEYRGKARYAEGEKILVGGRDTLLKKLRDEAHAGPAMDNDLVQRVRDLGKTEA